MGVLRVFPRRKHKAHNPSQKAGSREEKESSFFLSLSLSFLRQKQFFRIEKSNNCKIRYFSSHFFSFGDSMASVEDEESSYEEVEVTDDDDEDAEEEEDESEGE